jgi:hypothetical protein
MQYTLNLLLAGPQSHLQGAYSLVRNSEQSLIAVD